MTGLKISGVAINIWHHGCRVPDELRWLPRLHLSQSEAKAVAYRILLEDETSTIVRVCYQGERTEEAAASLRRITRLKNAWQKRASLN